MSVVGQLVKFAVSLLALEAKQAWKRWRSAPVRVPQSQGECERCGRKFSDVRHSTHMCNRPAQPLKVVQGGRR